MARKSINKILHNGKECLSLTFASSVCGYHRKRLRQLIISGELPGVVLNKIWFIEEEVLQKFLQNRTNSHVPLNRAASETKSDVNEKLLQTLSSIDNKLELFDKKFANFESKKITDIFAKLRKPKNPWDELLLQEESEFYETDPPKPFFKPALFKFTGFAVAASLAGFFVLNNAGAISQSLKIARAALEKFGTGTELALNKISFPISSENFKTANSFLAQLSYLKVDPLKLLEHSSLKFGGEVGQYIADMDAETMKFIEGYSVKSGQRLGVYIRGGGINNLPDRLLSFFVKEGEEVVVKKEEKTQAAPPSPASTLEEELSLLKSQGLS